MESNGCKKREIQFITIIPFKPNKKDTLFTIRKKNESFTFTSQSPFFYAEKESNSSLRCAKYEIEYSNIYYGNINDERSLLQGSLGLRSTRYVTNHLIVCNSWL